MFGLDETGDSGSTKCDLRSILVAKAKRRRPGGGESARGKRARNNPPGPTKHKTLAHRAGVLCLACSGWMRPATAVRQNATLEHFGRQSEAAAPRRGESARGKRARNNPPGPTKHKTLAHRAGVLCL